MNRQTRILGISGSLRRESYNSAALRAAVGLAPEGVAVETFELDGIPLFNLGFVALLILLVLGH